MEERQRQQQHYAKNKRFRVELLRGEEREKKSWLQIRDPGEEEVLQVPPPPPFFSVVVIQRREYNTATYQGGSMNKWAHVA